MFVHVPVRIEHSFRYAGVNTVKSLPPIVIRENPRRVRLDTLPSAERRRRVDSTARAATAAERRRLAARDSAEHGLRPPYHRFAVCDTAPYRVVTGYRYGEARLPVAVKIPCDLKALENSPDLPASIYDPSDALFSPQERDALLAAALSLGAQPPFVLGGLLRPTFAYGADLTRYNRVEGFSTGLRADEQLGDGYALSALGRFAFADRQPNAELSVTRSNLSESVHFTGYTHLASASDWGHPLSFGSSLSALLFGHDEGFYYYAAGAELGGDRDAPFGHGAHVEWRLFSERQRTAEVHVTSGLAGGEYPANLVAREGWYTGGGVRLYHSLGIDPQGFRLLSDLRMETAVSDSVYTRAAVDVTASHGLGALAGAVTLSGGNSVGAMPAQRRWYVGGAQTIRGESPDTALSGNAYWIARAELGSDAVGLRPVVFGDLGWVGDRNRLSQVGRPLSGVGFGTSFLDGLVRADLARGIYPRQQWRFDLYLESRF
jgi:hemolysin secretion/activation protein ShlB/FhaC/HecB